MAEEPTILDTPIPESHVRLVATPTAGIPAEHSPYYRRLVSAGYKGFLQGNIAGATLYGALGALVGVACAVAIPGIGAAVAVPLLAGFGVIKGATVFGQIGSNAAQLAEYAEMNERRNALLDRLYETKSNEEALEIRKLLSADTVDKPPTRLVHWRTLIIGAILGAAALGALAYLSGGALASTSIGHAFSALVQTIAPSLFEAGMASFSVIASSAAVGAVAGATIGIDRGWIRRWFDVSEGAVHERDFYEKMAQERAKEVSRLHKIGQDELNETRLINGINYGNKPTLPPSSVGGPATMQASQAPLNNVQAEHAQHIGRIAEAELARA